jgi:hypothetical protein
LAPSSPPLIAASSLSLPVANERHAQRLAMGSGAILSLGEACELLPVADREARSWLQELGLVRYLRGRPVIVWSEVQDALRNPSTPQPGAKPRPRLRLEREPL